RPRVARPGDRAGRQRVLRQALLPPRAPRAPQGVRRGRRRGIGPSVSAGTASPTGLHGDPMKPLLRSWAAGPVLLASLLLAAGGCGEDKKTEPPAASASVQQGPPKAQLDGKL